MFGGFLREWRFVTSTRPHIDSKQKELIVCQAFMVVGLAASESKFNRTPLVWVVLTGVYQ